MITQDSLFFEFTFYVLPWITYTIFLIGLIFQVRKWLSGAPSMPAEKSKVGLKGTIKALFLNLIIQRRTLKTKTSSYLLWLAFWLIFHIPLFFIIFGHFRSVGVWSVDWFTWLASRDFLTETLPFYMGFIVLAGIVLLTLRRIVFTAPRSISTLGNYIVLLLLMMVIVAGNIMRILPSDSPEEFTVIVPPGVTMQLEHTPSLVWFTIHALIAQITVMYLPFSGLIHIISGIVTTLANARGE